MEYMVCLNCRGDIPNDSVFCPFCGTNISELKEKFEKERVERELQRGSQELVSTYNQDAILKRAFLFLEDGDFDRADTYLENILDNDPENARAYVGKLMIDYKVKTVDDLKNAEESFENNGNYIKALRFGDEDLKIELKKQNNECVENVKLKKEQEEALREALGFEKMYQEACNRMTNAITEFGYTEAAEKFEKIKEYKDSAALAKECREKAEATRKRERKESYIAIISFVALVIIVVLLCIAFLS